MLSVSELESAARRVSFPLSGGEIAGWELGPPDRPVDLLFIHATGFCAAAYLPLLGPLSAGFRILAIDQRGHGRTRLPADPARLKGWTLYAADAAAVLERLNAAGARPVVAGHSLGGMVSLFAAARKERLARAVLAFDPPVLAPHWHMAFVLPGAVSMMKRKLPIARNAGRRRADFPSRAAALESYRGRGAFATWQPGFLEGYVMDGFLDTADGVRLACAPGWEQATFAAMRHNPWAAFKSLAVPASVLAAERHSTVKSLLPLIQRANPAIRTEVVAGGSHFFPMEQPELVRGRLRAALNQ